MKNPAGQIGTSFTLSKLPRWIENLGGKQNKLLRAFYVVRCSTLASPALGRGLRGRGRGAVARGLEDQGLALRRERRVHPGPVHLHRRPSAPRAQLRDAARRKRRCGRIQTDSCRPPLVGTVYGSGNCSTRSPAHMPPSFVQFRPRIAFAGARSSRSPTTCAGRGTHLGEHARRESPDRMW